MSSGKNVWSGEGGPFQEMSTVVFQKSGPCKAPTLPCTDKVGASHKLADLGEQYPRSLFFTSSMGTSVTIYR